MMHHYVSAIGAAALAVFTAFGAAAQTELPTRPDPAAQPAPAQPAPAVSAPYKPVPMPSNYPTSALGAEFGWGAPYGWGIEYAHMVSPNVDLNAGVGIGVGAKVGIGARYYLHPERALTPYFGANLSRTSGLNNVDVTLAHSAGYEEKANYSMTPSGVLHLRGGGRWQLGSIGLLGSIGYGVRFTGDPVVFNTYGYGQPSTEMRDLVQIISPGGLELSLGVLFGLGGR